MFKYVKEGDALEERGQVHRILEENLGDYLEKKLDNGEPKFKEVGFEDWKTYVPQEWQAAEGIVDPEYGLLDENGEPMESETDEVDLPPEEAE